MKFAQPQSTLMSLLDRNPLTRQSNTSTTSQAPIEVTLDESLVTHSSTVNGTVRANPVLLRTILSVSSHTALYTVIS